MNTDKIAEYLEEIINNGLEQSNIPYKKGNSIRIKNYAIRNSSKGYLIYDCEKNQQIARTYFKASAIAICKTLVDGNNLTTCILNLDKKLLKHYNDAQFYKNTIKKTKNEFKKEIRVARLELSVSNSETLRQNLDKYIFSDK